MTEQIDLMPCPFDGRTPIVQRQRVSHRVMCPSCFIEQSRETEAEAIAAWNTRAEAAPKPSDKDMMTAFERAGWEAVAQIARDRGDHSTAEEAECNAAALNEATPPSDSRPDVERVASQDELTELVAQAILLAKINRGASGYRHLRTDFNTPFPGDYQDAQAAIAAMSTPQVMPSEREAIVAWLRDAAADAEIRVCPTELDVAAAMAERNAFDEAADAIENGEHRKDAATGAAEMTPLERAARALHRLYTDEKVRAGAQDMPDWDDLGDDGKFYFIHRTRAVLQAIREPSEHSMDCGAYALPGVTDQAGKQAKARDVWRRMIDAALEE